MKKTMLLIAAMLLSTWAIAQTQLGFVKTLGRPDKAGEPLSGVTIRAKGGHNSVLSDSHGFFALPLAGKQNGDTYALQQVQKNGYELNETNVIGKQQVFSDKVPLTLVMASEEQLQADKERIENNAYKTAERNYKAKTAQLEQQLHDSIITAAKYHEAILELQEKFEQYQSMIDGLAEHYAHTDYDNLDSLDREINLSIENGDLDRADSLINTLFNPLDVLQRNMEALASIEQQIGQAQGILDQANADLAAVLKQQEKDGEHLFQLYTIALARFDNDKARFYIETRAELDTTNVDWQLAAGNFLYEYFADYEIALKYGLRALRQTQVQYGDHELTCCAYNLIGVVYDDMSEYETSIYYLEQMLAVSIRLFGEESYYAANAYSHLGSVHNDMEDLDHALEYALKALAIRERLPGNPRIAESYNNLAGLYSRLGEHEKAIEYYRKVMHIIQLENSYETIYAASIYENIGVAYGRMNEYDSALYYCQGACELKERLLSEGHPLLANSYFNLGIICRHLGNSTSALDYLNRAIAIEEQSLGPEHPEVATSYIGLGNFYREMQDPEKAMECYTHALEIYVKKYGENHQKSAGANMQIGTIYYQLGENDKALEHYNKTREVWEATYPENHPNLAILYNNIALCHFKSGDYDSAIEYFHKALVINEQVYGTDHPKTAKIQVHVGNTYKAAGDKEKAREYYNQALSTYRQNYGDDHQETQQVMNSLRQLDESQDE